MATYKSRISSDSISFSISRARAVLDTVEYRTRRAGSTRSAPSPSREWTKTGRFMSSLLNFRFRSHNMTTGNSSPLDRWMLIMRTPPVLCSDAICGSLPRAMRLRR